MSMVGGFKVEVYSEVYSENFSEDLYWGSVVRFTVVRYSGGIQLRYILEV